MSSGSMVQVIIYLDQIFNLMANQETILTVENLGVKFDNNEILRGLNFFVQKGDVLAILDDPSVLRKIDETIINYYVNKKRL